LKRQELEEKLIKKAWEDSEFKKQLLSDPVAVFLQPGRCIYNNLCPR